MFCSPGSAPALFRDNGPITFQKFRRFNLRQQDAAETSASTSVAWDFSVGRLEPTDLKGYLLPEPDFHVVDGRPVVGMLGRNVLPKGSVVELDMPGRRIIISESHDNCPNAFHPIMARSIEMQEEILLVPVRINGQFVEAVLKPDLPVKILTREIDNKIEIDDPDIANDPLVVKGLEKLFWDDAAVLIVLDVGKPRMKDPFLRAGIELLNRVQEPKLWRSVGSQSLERNHMYCSFISSRTMMSFMPKLAYALACLIPIGSTVILATVPTVAAELQPVSYPMTAAAWTVAPPANWAGNTSDPLKFARYEGMPTGTLTVNEAIAVSADASFSNGTIEFDIKPLAYSDTGIIFHRHGNEDGEIVYLRANPDCPAADDCLQYAPITHGLMQWDIYPDYEGPAPIAPQGWNHIRLVVAGQKMIVYVNRNAEPSLVVPKLQGLRTDGGIAFKGPAIYSNLIIRADNRPALSDVHQAAADPGTVTAWLAAMPIARASNHAVLETDIPLSDAWHPIAAEATGLVNLSRAFGVGRAPSISVGWLKTVVTATVPVRRTMRIGWAREVSVFLNGKLVFSGDNPYYPSEHRLSPNGRLEADNALVPLDLRQGQNEIVIAVTNGWQTYAGVEKADPYGWGAEAHFDQLAGIVLNNPR